MSLSLMNSVFRNVARALPVHTRSLGLVPKPLTRSLWYLSHSTTNFTKNLSSINNHHNGSCPCGTCGIHTKGDKELVEFLSEEIATEKQGRKSSVPSSFEGFAIKYDGAEMILSKKFNNEQVELVMNLNHSVDTDLSEGDLNDKADNAPDSDLKSKPQFEVKLIKGSTTTRLACSYVQDGSVPSEEGTITDAFTIDELAVYEGAVNGQTYAVAGDILDGYMYDLLMNLLEERGISNEFVEKLSDLATNKEHDLYVNMLQRLQKFIEAN
nr:EOG090X0APE [Sida crystallina]